MGHEVVSLLAGFLSVVVVPRANCMCLVKVLGFSQFKIPGGLSVVVHSYARLTFIQMLAC